jgi:hypothetical protein
VIGKKEYGSGYVGDMERRKQEASKGREFRKESVAMVGLIVAVGAFGFWMWRGGKNRDLFRKGSGT